MGDKSCAVVGQPITTQPSFIFKLSSKYGYGSTREICRHRANGESKKKLDPTKPTGVRTKYYSNKV